MSPLGSQASHYTTDLPTGPQQMWAFLSLTSMCSLQVSQEARTTPRCLTNIEWRKAIPKRCGSKNPGSFLLIVNATSPVLSGLTYSPSSSRHISTVWRAHCMSPNTVFGNFPLKDKCHLHILEYKLHPLWTLLSDHQQHGTIGALTRHLPMGSL